MSPNERGAPPLDDERACPLGRATRSLRTSCEHANGTDSVQGFHFSPALAPDAFTAWLADRTTPLAA